MLPPTWGHIIFFSLLSLLLFNIFVLAKFVTMNQGPTFDLTHGGKTQPLPGKCTQMGTLKTSVQMLCLHLLKSETLSLGEVKHNCTSIIHRNASQGMGDCTQTYRQVCWEQRRYKVRSIYQLPKCWGKTWEAHLCPMCASCCTQMLPDSAGIQEREIYEWIL